MVKEEKHSDQPCPDCDQNPDRLVCICKTFREKGICEHVLAVRVFRGELNFEQLTAPLGGGRKTRRKGGYRGGLRSYLQREEPPPPGRIGKIQKKKSQTRPAAKPAAQQVRKRAKAAPAKRLAKPKAKPAKKSSRSPRTFDYGGALTPEEFEAWMEQQDREEAEEEMARRDQEEVEYGPTISDRRPSRPSVTRPSAKPAAKKRRTGARDAETPCPAAKKRVARPASKKKKAAVKESAGAGRKESKRGPPPRPGTYEGTHTSCVSCLACTIPLVSGNPSHTCEGCGWPVHSATFCELIFRLPGEDNENNMFCVDCAPEDSRSDAGAEPGDALGRLIQSGKKRSERRTEAERTAAADAERVFDNGVRINPFLRQFFASGSRP